MAVRRARSISPPIRTGKRPALDKLALVLRETAYWPDVDRSDEPEFYKEIVAIRRHHAELESPVPGRAWGEHETREWADEQIRSFLMEGKRSLRPPPRGTEQQEELHAFLASLQEDQEADRAGHPWTGPWRHWRIHPSCLECLERMRKFAVRSIIRPAADECANDCCPLTPPLPHVS